VTDSRAILIEWRLMMTGRVEPRVSSAKVSVVDVPVNPFRS
jgi:hypothetical protein